MARVAALGALLALAGCSRCGGAKPPAEVSVERLLPKGSVGVVVAPSVEVLGQRLAALQALKVAGFAAQLQGFRDGAAWGDRLVAELGLDLRSPEALEKAGIDGRRAAGAAVLLTGHVYLALPVRDASRLGAGLEQLAKRRLGATQAGERTVGSATLKTFSPPGGEARLGYLVTDGYVLLAADDSVGQLPGMASMPESDSLASDAVLKAALSRLGAPGDVYVWLPDGSVALQRTPLASVLVTATLTPTGLAVAADARWRGDAAQLKALEPAAGPDVLGFLPRDAFLVLRHRGDPTRLTPFVDALLGPHVMKAFTEAGFDVKTQALGAVKPGVAVSLSLADRPPLDRGLPEFDIRRTNPFSYAHLSGVATVVDGAAARATLDQVAALAPRFGAQMRPAERDGQPVLLTSWAQGEGVHFAVKGDRLLFASPVQRLDALLAADGAGGSPVAGLGDEALALAVDLTRLSASVRALPASAWGIGGFAIKPTTVRWLDATDDLKAVTLGVSAKGDAVQARLGLRLQSAPAQVAP